MRLECGKPNTGQVAGIQLAGIFLQLPKVLLDLLKLKNIFSQNMHSFVIERLALLSIKSISCWNSGIILLQQSVIQICVTKLNSNKSRQSAF